MSDMKFACPVCGQHLTASSADSGQKIECPTCFQQLIVPQRSGDSKLVVNATRAGERRSIPGRGESSRQTSRRRTTGISISAAVLVLVLCALVYAIINRQHFWRKTTTEQVGDAGATNTLAASAPVVASGLPWSLDVKDGSFTNAPVKGRIHGEPFDLEWSVLQGGTLTLRQGRSRLPDLTGAIYLSAARGEDLAGKVFVIASDQPAAPQIQLRWKDEQQKSVTKRFRTGYAMKLAFDQPTNGFITGRIWLSVPDLDQSVLWGGFNAEIRKPQPKKSPAKKPVAKPQSGPAPSP